jgi:hypothetical protein
VPARKIPAGATNQFAPEILRKPTGLWARLLRALRRWRSPYGPYEIPGLQGRLEELEDQVSELRKRVRRLETRKAPSLLKVPGAEQTGGQQGSAAAGSAAPGRPIRLVRLSGADDDGPEK